MGYTPLFDSITKGTLCGKWPDIGLWPVILSLADWRGEIDATHQYISNVTGLSLEEVAACIERFCAPDPSSRSQEASGARLVLVDQARNWGWRVVNLQKYRERARNANQVADGRNAEKVRKYKKGHRETPGDTGGHSGTRHSYSYSYSDSNKEQEGAIAPVPGLDLKAWGEWYAYRKATKPLKAPSILRAKQELARFGDAQAQVVSHSIANGYQGLFAPKPQLPSKPRRSEELAAKYPGNEF